MTDIFSKEKRSEIMSLIKPKGTKPELLAFKELRRRGIYFQKHYKGAPGSPDIALPRKKKAVLIDGDFWHGYRFNQKKSRLPKKYWRAKIQDNVNRDRKNRIKLRGMGWKVMRVWEHEILKNLANVIDKIELFLQ
jgi:DNA mismatch endonuclease, patch repair protein